MKLLYIISIALCSLQFSGWAQCEENATSFGNNRAIPAYNVTGDVVIKLKPIDQTITLDLGDNFMTGSGPDVRAFLVNSDGLSNEDLTKTKINELENIFLGLVDNDSNNQTNQNGTKSFTVPIPNGVNIENFDKVFFYCLNFDQFWDFGSYPSFSVANCNVLSIEENTLTKTFLYPNPTKDILHISNSINNIAEIRIFDTKGNLMIRKQKIDYNDQMDVSTLAAGLYLVELSSPKQKEVYRLMVQ